MTNFERLMQCKTPEEALLMLCTPTGEDFAWCAERGSCREVCISCVKEWLESDSYKPRHMKEDA